MTEVIKPTFVFINDAPHGDDAATLLKRRAVRAQAARQQPAAAKDRASQQVKSAAKWNKYQARKRNRHQTTRNTFQLNLTSLEDLPPSSKSATSKSRSKSKSERGGSVAGYPTPKASSQHSGEAATESTGSGPTSNDHESILSPRISGAGSGYPFVQLQCLQLPFTPMLLDHYLTNLATDIPELDAGTPGILRSRWFPMVITADATLNIVLLTAASHYAVFTNKIGDPSIKEMLLYLKCQTYAAVQRLIKASSPELRSDALIGAVAKLASYEAMFGTPELYHLHIRNLQIMIGEKGGLDALGLGGLLQRMVLWIDINSAFLLNSTAYFLPSVPLAGHVIRQPNPSGFLGEY